MSLFIALFGFTLSYLISSHLISSHRIVSYRIVSYHTLFFRILSKAPLRGVPATALDLSLNVVFLGSRRGMKNRSNIDAQINEKSTKHLPNIDQNSTPNRPKMDLGGVLGPKTVCLPCGWALGAFCGPLEANMAATWAPRWRPNCTKINAKIDAKNRCVLDVHFG